AVAKTMGKGLVDLSVVDASVILAGLLGAICWDLITWWGGLPTSSSHALMGGYGGAAVAKAGFSAILVAGWVKPVVFIVVAPFMGLTIALLLYVALSWLLRRALPRRVDRVFRVLQLGSAAAYSLGHGTNDAQKTMGIVVGLLVAEQRLFADFPVRALHVTTADHVPTWVILLAGAAMGLGTMAGGWRIVRTMGQRLTKLVPFGGFCAEASGAITLFVASHFGIPVSTTHTITGAISVVGAAERCTSLSMLSRMRRVMRRMLCSDSLSSGCVSTASASSSSPSARIVASALFTSCRIVTATWLITASRSPWIARA